MIRVTNLSKFYGGKRALGPVSFEIADGETVGFLGLNGAGKTTALRILACDLRPSAGSIQVGGTDAVYGDMTVRNYLRFAAELRGLRGAAFTKRLPKVLAVTDLGDVADDVIRTLSHGFRQRVGVAQAIVHNPEFLILDEPTRGLDPVQIVEMRKLIHELKQEHTVLISSHILTEISQTCDRLLILGKGHLLGAGTQSELSTHEGDIRQVTVAVRATQATNAAAITTLLASVSGVSAVGEPTESGGGLLFALSTNADVRAAVSRAVVGAGLDLIKLDYSRGELENTFIRLVGGNNDEGN